MSMTNSIITRTPLILKVVSLYVVMAAFGWTAHQYVQTEKPAEISYQAIQTKQPVETLQGTPARVTIERLGINLSIMDGAYDATNDSWTLSDTSAHFASMTALPNNKQGNTFIYGHNTNAVFEPVKDLVAGDVLKIQTTNGHTFNYVYSNDLTVTPNQTDVLTADSSKPQITLMTCQGIFSETRRIMHFDYIGIS